MKLVRSVRRALRGLWLPAARPSCKQSLLAASLAGSVSAAAAADAELASSSGTTDPAAVENAFD